MTDAANHVERATPRVVVVGGGFGGLNAAWALRAAPVEVVVIDRRNHHLFQPLLYQVATASLSPADIATPIRKALRRQRNARVALGEVMAVDLAAKRVQCEDVALGYDWLVLGAGATHSYFGRDEWARFAPGLKTVEDATEIRNRFLLAFESAELEGDAESRRAILTFVVVGAGPTGVELAGAMIEIARTAIPRDFRAIDTTTARVILIEAQERVLPSFAEECSRAARRHLEQLGVEVWTGMYVTEVDAGGVRAGDQRIEARNVIWAAGVQASGLARSLGAPLDKAGRVMVEADGSLPGHPEAFVIGDLAHMKDPTGAQVPGMAQGAIQSGRHVGRIIAREARARHRGESAPPRPAFRYRDKGSLATIGRNKAVADLRGLHLHGRIAWVLWAVVHVWSLISTRNRFAVMLSWMWDYIFFDRGARLITGDAEVQVRSPRTGGGDLP